MRAKYLLPLSLLLLAACKPAEARQAARPQPPSVLFGALYRAVEMQSVFTDQKTFADAIPLQPPADIMAAYEQEKNRPGFDLSSFVGRHFHTPMRKSVDYKTRPEEPVRAYISDMWTVLERRPDEAERYSSLLPLPRPYVVPGGRFSEIYYWDSFFTMLGLEQDNRHDLAVDMLQNMASLIERYGHIPNGNRSYYLSRSEPPFFSNMVELIAQRDGEAVYRTYLPQMQQEYDYWMEGADSLQNGQAHRHVVRLADGTLLNRYWDDRAAPRDEAWRHDVATASRSSRPADQVYRDLRAGAETGWDFSSRWLSDGRDLASIRTTALAPVDLNCLMVHMEQVLAQAYRLKGDGARATAYRRRAQDRAAAIRRLMWDPQARLFTDYLWKEQQRTDIVSVATVYPLSFGLASAEQAKAVAASLRQRLLEAGGLLTTLVVSGQQWDRPNGWAPMQFLAIEGLNRYGEKPLAGEIADRWMRRNLQAYAASGTLLDKYSVEPLPRAASGRGGGGEYPLQIGFGWTNGVLVRLMAQYPERTRQSLQQHPAAAMLVNP